MIDDLALKYKTTGSIVVRNTLFNKLMPIIKQKAKYVYWYKSYKLYDKICRVKHLYNVTKEDIFQDLSLDVLTWIEKFNGVTSFRKYLFSCLWNWRPSIINKETYMNIKSIKCMSMSTHQKEKLMDNLAEELKFDIREGMASLLGEVKCPKEKAVLKLLYINPDIAKADIAKVLGVTKGRVSQIFAKLKANNSLYDFIKNKF